MKATSAQNAAEEAANDSAEHTSSGNTLPGGTQALGRDRRIAVDSRRVEALDAEIGRLARRLHADSYRMLLLIREFDDRFGYAKWSYKTCAEWVAVRLQTSLGAAREKVRTAQALRFLPKISAAFAEGQISYTKARELTRVAREHDEDLLLAYARNASAAQVTDRCRQIRNVLPESADSARSAWERRSLTVARNPTRNTLMISVELPAEDGEIVLRALECAVASGEVVALGTDHLAAHGTLPDKTDGWMAQQADALVAVSRAYLARDFGDVDEADEVDELGELDEVGGNSGDALGVEAGEEAANRDGSESGASRTDAEQQDATQVAFFMSNDPLAPPTSSKTPEAPKKQRPRKRGTSVADHYQIVVHVDERALRDCGRHGSSPGHEGAHNGATTPPRSDLPLETIRRLACDCSLIALVEDESGTPLGISRKSRVVPPYMWRALLARDRGCTFPGCHRHAYLDAHHIEHWINKGLTVPENLTLLCTYHHRLVHEGAFSIRKLDDGTLIFLRPDGRVIPRSGYRHEDMVDDEIDDEADRVVADELRDEVRETAPRYGPLLLAASCALRAALLGHV